MITIALNHFDNEGNVVDTSTMMMAEASASDIIDHAAQLILVMRGMARNKAGIDAFDQVCAELESALVIAGVVDDKAESLLKLKQPCDYLVKWTIDIDADTPKRAAKKAREMMQNPGSEAVVFDVFDSKGQMTTVDLLDDDEDSPLGLERALEELDENSDLKLWEVEIGLFDSTDDPNTAFDSHTVYMATEDAEEAVSEALGVVEDNFSADDAVTFSLLATPSEVNKTDFC